MDGLMFDTERIGVLGWHEAAKSFGYRNKARIFKGYDWFECQEHRESFQKILRQTICPFMI